MRKSIVFLITILIAAVILTGCGNKKEPAAPTAVPTEIPTETISQPTEAPAAEGSADEAEASGSNLEEALTVMKELGEQGGEQMVNSAAFLMLDTAGKRIWKAPLAGIEEFQVPDFMFDAHGGIRASGGYEMFSGTGIVSLDVYYYSMTEQEYYDLVGQMIEAVNSTEDIDETFGISKRYIEASSKLNSHRHPLFSIYGIGSGQDENGIVATEREYLASYNLYTEEEIEELVGGRSFEKIGSAEDYNFFYVQEPMDEEDLQHLEAEGDAYKAEYQSLFSAKNQIAPNFTFMRPIGIQELIEEGTGLTFETLDVFGNPVKSADLFKGHKVTMFNIWATTCSACISEMPELIKLNKEFGEKGGQIVGLVFDAVEDDIVQEAKDITSDLGIDFTTLLPNEYLRTTFDAMSYPITYFINEKGEILGEPLLGARVDAYREKMDLYLSQ